MVAGWRRDVRYRGGRKVNPERYDAGAGGVNVAGEVVVWWGVDARRRQLWITT
jgi:hypothetical protein